MSPLPEFAPRLLAVTGEQPPFQGRLVQRIPINSHSLSHLCLYQSRAGPNRSPGTGDVGHPRSPSREGKTECKPRDTKGRNWSGLPWAGSYALALRLAWELGSGGVGTGVGVPVGSGVSIAGVAVGTATGVDADAQATNRMASGNGTITFMRTSPSADIRRPDPSLSSYGSYGGASNRGRGRECHHISHAFGDQPPRGSKKQGVRPRSALEHQ